MTDVIDLFSQPLQLPDSQRAELAHQLLLTLEPEGEVDLSDESWLDEIGARLNVVQDGNYTAYDWEETIERMRTSLGQRKAM